MDENLPTIVTSYLDSVVKRLKDHLSDELVGVFLFGSAAYGAYEPDLSDLDVQVVVRDHLEDVTKLEIVRHLNQEALKCPASKLELVVYSQDAVHCTASHNPRFELNLNTGPNQQDHISFDPESESSHWFVLDIAMGRELGRCLYGLPVTEAFGAISRTRILEAISTSLEWHQMNELALPNSVLNACRGWRFVSTGKFASKLEGAKWALQQKSCPDVVEKAIRARKTGEELPAVQVSILYDMVHKVINAELGSQNDPLPPRSSFG